MKQVKLYTHFKTGDFLAGGVVHKIKLEGHEPLYTAFYEKGELVDAESHSTGHGHGVNRQVRKDSPLWNKIEINSRASYRAQIKNQFPNENLTNY